MDTEEQIQSRCGCTLKEHKDIWGETTMMTQPCADHAPLINHLQTLQMKVRNLQEELSCLNIWAQEICRMQDCYDREAMDGWRDIIKNCFKEVAAAMTHYDSPATHVASSPGHAVASPTATYVASSLGHAVAYTDGACSGNPGRGGWGVVFLDGRTFSGGEAATTNNRMEMMAVIRALEETPPGDALTLHIDSQYVIKGITQWMAGWKRNGWLTAAKKPVKNKELWERLDALTDGRPGRVEYKWVKGHSGDPHNDEADALAVAAIGKVV